MSRAVTVGRTTIPMSNVERIVEPAKRDGDYEVHLVEGYKLAASYIYFTEVVPAAPGFELVRVDEENCDKPTGRPWLSRMPVVAWKTYECVSTPFDDSGMNAEAVGLFGSAGRGWHLHDKAADMVYDTAEVESPCTYAEWLARESKRVAVEAKRPKKKAPVTGAAD